MIEIPTILAIAALAAPAGVAAGWLHFRSLLRVSECLAAGDLKAVVLQVVRFIALGLFFYLCVRMGATALLSAAAGLWVGRSLVLRQARKEAA